MVHIANDHKESLSPLPLIIFAQHGVSSSVLRGGRLGLA